MLSYCIGNTKFLIFPNTSLIFVWCHVVACLRADHMTMWRSPSSYLKSSCLNLSRSNDHRTVWLVCVFYLVSSDITVQPVKYGEGYMLTSPQYWLAVMPALIFPYLWSLLTLDHWGQGQGQVFKKANLGGKVYALACLMLLSLEWSKVGLDIYSISLEWQWSYMTPISYSLSKRGLMEVAMQLFVSFALSVGVQLDQVVSMQVILVSKMYMKRGVYWSGHIVLLRKHAVSFCARCSVHGRAVSGHDLTPPPTPTPMCAMGLCESHPAAERGGVVELK